MCRQHSKAGRNTEQSARIFICLSFFRCFYTTERECERYKEKERQRDKEKEGERVGEGKNGESERERGISKRKHEN